MNQNIPENFPVEGNPNISGENKKTPEEPLTVEASEPIIETQPGSQVIEQPAQVQIPQDPQGANQPDDKNKDEKKSVSDNFDPSLVAQDNDTIEPGWVKKVEEVIEKDKNLPFQEEEDFEDLQIEYLKKRFGKDINKGDQ